jgi:hypothetical protein
MFRPSQRVLAATARRASLHGSPAMFTTIANVKFERTSSAATPPEVAYEQFAAARGLCDLSSFYRGTTRAYYALAAALGGPMGAARHARATASSPMLAALDRATDADAKVAVDHAMKSALAATVREDVLFALPATGDAPRMAASDAWPSDLTQGDCENFRDNEDAAAGSLATPRGVASVRLLRALFTPAFRRELYATQQALVVREPQTQVMGQRTFRALAHADERIDALQIAAVELVRIGPPPPPAPTADATGATGAEPAAAPAPATVTSQSSAEAQTLVAAATATNDDLDVIVTVKLLVQAPPGRYCVNYEYFRAHMRTDGVADHFGGSAEAAAAAADATARVLAVSNVYNIFRCLDWITRRLFSTPSKLDPRALPLPMLGLSEEFPTQPARVVKTLTMHYSRDVGHWRILGASADGHFFQDFSRDAWISCNGAVGCE